MDDVTLKVFSSACKVSDVTEENVSCAVFHQAAHLHECNTKKKFESPTIAVWRCVRFFLTLFSAKSCTDAIHSSRFFHFSVTEFLLLDLSLTSGGGSVQEERTDDTHVRRAFAGVLMPSSEHLEGRNLPRTPIHMDRWHSTQMA